MEERELRRGFADTPEGPIHYAESGSGPPVLCLHQTPRSWDEFRDVLPRLGCRFRALAMDTVGYGDSYRPAEPASIDRQPHGRAGGRHGPHGGPDARGLCRDGSGVSGPAGWAAG